MGKSKQLEEALEDEEEVTAEERRKRELLEGEGRMCYDPINKVINMNKKRVSDLPDNTFVTMPKPLPGFVRKPS